MCMCLVLFVVSEIPESSRLLCFFLYEIRIECNLLSHTRYVSSTTAINSNASSLLDVSLLWKC